MQFSIQISLLLQRSSHIRLNHYNPNHTLSFLTPSHAPPPPCPFCLQPSGPAPPSNSNRRAFVSRQTRASSPCFLIFMSTLSRRPHRGRTLILPDRDNAKIVRPLSLDNTMQPFPQILRCRDSTAKTCHTVATIVIKNPLQILHILLPVLLASLSALPLSWYQTSPTADLLLHDHLPLVFMTYRLQSPFHTGMCTCNTILSMLVQVESLASHACLAPPQ